MACLLARVVYSCLLLIRLCVSARYSDLGCSLFGRSCYEVHGACDVRINLYPAAPIQMPSAASLPEGTKALAARNAVSIIMSGFRRIALTCEEFFEKYSKNDDKRRWGRRYWLRARVLGDGCSPSGQDRRFRRRYNWSGLASTVYWVDPAEEAIEILMAQLTPSSKYSLRRGLRQLTYQAMIN
jgi:CubicO group peptidase (beta-lactamase class C family)